MGFADLGEVRLHYVEAGEGPLVVLLHGFPEFWYGVAQADRAARRGRVPRRRAGHARLQPLVEAGGRRGYDLDPLAADIRDLIAERGAERACVAGHDWGGAVAWRRRCSTPRSSTGSRSLTRRIRAGSSRRCGARVSLAKSWYMRFFQLPLLPERSGRWSSATASRTTRAPGAFTPEDLARYEEAWSQPGALTGSLNYYRALSRQTPWGAERRIVPIEAPTRVIWGTRDRYLVPDLAEPHRSDVPNLERVVRLDTSHWVQHDAPEQIVDQLTEFFGPAR